MLHNGSPVERVNKPSCLQPCYLGICSLCNFRRFPSLGGALADRRPSSVTVSSESLHPAVSPPSLSLPWIFRLRAVQDRDSLSVCTAPSTRGPRSCRHYNRRRTPVPPAKVRLQFSHDSVQSMGKSQVAQCYANTSTTAQIYALQEPDP